MALRVIPIRQSGNRPNLFMGGDRELVMFSILIAATSIFAAMEIKTAIFGIALWIFALFALRLMAKHDPMLRHVYLRQLHYKRYYPARSTPFYDNLPRMERQFQ
ncbi:conjugal transfer protein TrbD [Nitrosomonas aestuarii]|uniref:conjugal transfer protein TrbD n=1 Tax=Nitrosomonas aestuarii TaxID=52441 RepID=UPI000D30B0E4|nr:conjugal transfer protein TrbD [Nitrosomonas aestuarii]PTN07561.1 type IV secretion system protein VirB3 [Nitrosomonas aestuarii]